jgi:hypothetical protein
MDIKLPDLYALSPQQIQQVIDDLRLVIDDNAKIFYAVDPHELNDFCFPIDPTSNRPVNIKTIADDQAALFEVFYRQRPLLLREYEREMERKLTHYEGVTEALGYKSEMIDRLIREGELVWEDHIPGEEAEAQAYFLRENFSIILAIAMGIQSLGVARLKNVYYSHLIDSDPLRDATPREAPTVRRILNSYARTPHRDLILKQLGRPISEGSEREDESTSSRSYEVDADAIDHLIYLNTAFEEARLAGELDGRYLFVYLSSVMRTTRVFTYDTAYTFLPRINNQPYNFWRTRRQVFAYVVHKSREGKHAESLRNLERVRNVIEEVRKFEGLFSSADCHNCVLKGGSASNQENECRWVDFCRKVKGLDDEIQNARRQVHNLGLINTLNDYEALRNATPKGKSQTQYLEFFRATFDNPLTRNARPKMERLQNWILVKSAFTTSFTSAFGMGKPGFDQSSLRSPDDFVTGSGQYLPTKPKLWTRDYIQILGWILGFYRNPTKFDQVENAYKHFVELDTETRGINLEHELIRCLLYLALPRPARTSQTDSPSSTGDEKAYLHAEAIMEGEKLLDRSDWEKAPESVKQEFRYVQSWAARRSGRYQKAVELAQEGTAHEPEDPRFFHGLCLSIYSWLSKKPEESTPTLDAAIAATRTAIFLYLKTAEGDHNNDVIAANYNNLAYFLAWSVALNQEASPADRPRAEAHSHKAIAEARDALHQLKELIDKNEWEKTKHPEFFHTEAYLEYQEFTIAMAEGDRDKARAKLADAKHDIDLSIKLLEEGPMDEEYRKLRDQINRGLEMLG